MKMRTFMIVGLVTLLAQRAFTQSPAPAAGFDAADVHLRSKVTASQSMSGGVLRNGRYDLRNATMVDLITTAYNVQPDVVLGGPTWLETRRFDIVAKAPDGTRQDTLRPMLQSLLAERFKLALRKETRPIPAYVLSAGSAKHKMKPSNGDGSADCQPPAQPPAPGSVPMLTAICRNITMDAFAIMLRNIGGGYITELVTNHTGIEGAFDFELNFTPQVQLAIAGSEGVTLPNAIDKQLGLKLALETVPSPVLVVDSVNEQPIPNPSGASYDVPAPPPAEFDVASIKLSPPEMTGALGRIQPGGRIDLQGATLQNLIMIAWEINDPQLISGAPDWLDKTRYSINALATSSVSGRGTDMQIDISDLDQMLKALLIERFQLKTHMEDRPVSAYTLLADKPKLQPGNPGDRTRWKNGPAPYSPDPRNRNPILSRLVTVQNMTMAEFADVLQPIAPGYLRLPVADETGLAGRWTFTFNFSPVGAVQPAAAARPGDGTGGAAPAASDPTGAISLFDAINKQLGLKLDMRKRPMPVLVIDHVEQKPIEN